MPKRPRAKSGKDDARKRVGENLRRLREARGLTQRELAERIGAHEARISELEKGKHGARVDTLQRVASALGVDVSELFIAL